LAFEKEFFIRKAIGWALREYSKSNPNAVRAFIQENNSLLSPLSIKEGSKYL
jgi:3-methyladenine DNA glycosylase AlkD